MSNVPAQAKEENGELIVRPRSERDLSSLVGVLRAQGRTLHSVRLDRSAFRQVTIDEVSGLAEVGSGVTLQALETQLATARLSLGPLAPQVMPLELGEVLEHPAFSLRSAPRGRLESLASDVSGVMEDGSIVRSLPVRGAGPMLAALLLGAERRAGIITSARVRLVPLAETSQRVRFSFDEPGRAVEAIRALLAEGGKISRAVLTGRAVELSCVGSRAAVERNVELMREVLERSGRWEAVGEPMVVDGPLVEASWSTVLNMLTAGKTIGIYRPSISSVLLCD